MHTAPEFLESLTIVFCVAGVTILVVLREGDAILPTGKNILQAGDMETLAGTVEAAKEILTVGPAIP